MIKENNSPVEVAQITDLHLGSSFDHEVMGVNTAFNTALVLQSVSQSTYHQLIATGDISDDFSTSSYLLFFELLKNNNISKLTCLAGNHDNYELMESILHPVMQQRLFKIKNWVFIGLNTNLLDSDSGLIGYKELNWLKKALTDNSEFNVAIFMHHHIFSVSSKWIDKYNLIDSGEFLKIIFSNPNVKAVISGHVHQQSFIFYEGVEFHTTCSTSFQYLPNADCAVISSKGPGWRKWFFWPSGKISEKWFPLKDI